MVRLACDGAGLLEAVRAAVANLEAHADEINALNVFPVPDGDTGSNMVATCREMLDYVRDDSSVETVAERLREGALFGARGNSGVILSQVVRGLAEGFAGKRALQRARPRPCAGARLDCRVRGGAQAGRGHDADRDPRGVRRRRRDRRAVERRRSGPLGGDARCRARARQDAEPAAGAARGGRGGLGRAGLLRLFEGALAYVRGEVVVPAMVRAPRMPSPTPAEYVHVESGHGYETVYLLHPFPGQLLDLDRIRGYLVRDR